jgi:hypothetical protein
LITNFLIKACTFGLKSINSTPLWLQNGHLSANLEIHLEQNIAFLQDPHCFGKALSVIIV